MSLLRRLEQGQSGQPAATPSAADADKGSRLGNIQARRVAPPSGGGQHDAYLDLKSRVQNRLLSELDPTTDTTKVNEVRSNIGYCTSLVARVKEPTGTFQGLIIDFFVELVKSLHHHRRFVGGAFHEFAENSWLPD